MKKWLYWAAGGLALMAFWILSGPDRKVKKLTKQRDDLLLDGSGKARHKAFLAGVKADAHQRNAVVAADAGKKAMDKAAANSDSMRQILSDWRG